MLHNNFGIYSSLLIHEVFQLVNDAYFSAFIYTHSLLEQTLQKHQAFIGLHQRICYLTGKVHLKSVRKTTYQNIPDEAETTVLCLLHFLSWYHMLSCIFSFLVGR